ncbi:MAG TPA: hypothetical protein PKB10_05315 [Tepidisphaeraceae bacterium]|nr:hypothetical protein [Tepidisphaeraceae bacterium]
MIIDFIYDPIDPGRKIASATAIALVMLLVSLAILLLLNGMDYLSRKNRS